MPVDPPRLGKAGEAEAAEGRAGPVVNDRIRQAVARDEAPRVTLNNGVATVRLRATDGRLFRVLAVRGASGRVQLAGASPVMSNAQSIQLRMLPIAGKFTGERVEVLLTNGESVIVKIVATGKN